MLAHDLESPYTERLAKWVRDHDWDNRITTKVECGDYFGVRDQALLAHATQIDPDGFWFAIPREIQVSTWPTEDYELVESYVDSPLPEDDLFAGITSDSVAAPTRSCRGCDVDAAGWDERYAATDLVWSAGPNQFVEAACADLPPGRAVDLAAGEGRNAIWLARRGWQVTAVDFSQVGLDKGAHRRG